MENKNFRIYIEAEKTLISKEMQRFFIEENKAKIPPKQLIIYNNKNYYYARNTKLFHLKKYILHS